MEKQENGKMKGIKYKVSWLLNCYAHTLFHNAYKISATQSTEISLRTCQTLTKHPPLILLGYSFPLAFCHLLLCIIPSIFVLTLHMRLNILLTAAYVSYLTQGDSQASQLFSSPILTVLPMVFGNVLSANPLGHSTLLTQCSVRGTL